MAKAQTSAAGAAAVPASPAYATPFNEKEAGVDLQEIHDFAVDLVLRAGALVRARTRRRRRRSLANASGVSLSMQPQEKASEIDLVTEVDLAVEEMILSSIRARFPSHAIVAEESYGAGSSKGHYTSARGPTWLVDPIDGTLNFTHLLPLHSISIGFSCTHSSIPDDALVGCIYAPNLGPLGTLWSGVRGRGAYLSYPARLPTSKRPSVDHGCHLAQLEERSDLSYIPTEDDEGECDEAPLPQRLPLERAPLPYDAPSRILLASEWGKDRRRGKDSKGNLARKLTTLTTLAASDDLSPSSSSSSCDGNNGKVPHLHGVRSLGSSTLDMAFCAQGSIDVVWEGGCWEWDVCAGIAILLEAGGMVTDANPPPSKSSPYWHDADVPRAELGARRFLVVRSCTGTEEETNMQAQQRVVRQIWERTPGLDYRRPGVTYHVETKSYAKATSSVQEIRHLNGDKVGAERSAESGDLPEAPPLNDEEEMEEESQKHAIFGGRLLDESKDRWQHNAWDHVEPPESHRAQIQSILSTQAETKLSAMQAEPFHAQPASYWNKFYASHENRFFKHRRWLHLEFPELVQASQRGAPPARILEVGCGAGNTVFPLLEVNENENLEIFACDYSSEAVDVVKSNPIYSDTSRPGRCRASVWDLSSPSAEIDGVSEGSLDIIVLIFVLSALRPSEWPQAARNVHRLLKPGGLVLFRDYGRHDLPQLRFKKGRMLDENFYIRGDGTRVYFFEPQEVLDIFGATTPTSLQTDETEMQPESHLVEEEEEEKEEEGVERHHTNGAGEDNLAKTCISRATDTTPSFETVQMAVDRRMLLNRKEKKEMYRVWLQAKLRRL